jgi:hypothetical protein
MSWQPVSSGRTTCPSPGLFMSISRNPTERGYARHSNSQQKPLECTTALCASTLKKKYSDSPNFFQNYTHETLVEFAKRKEETGFIRRPRLEFGTQYQLSLLQDRYYSPNATEYPLTEIATLEPALSEGEILRLRIRMTGSEGACNDMRYHSRE